MQRVQTQFLNLKSPFPLSLGGELPSVRLAYETYGTLNEERSNAILLFHALTGSQHAHGYNPLVPELYQLWQEENHLGWWDSQIGPGKALDTDKYFIICANYLGSCYGTTGPISTNPSTGFPWMSAFPRVTVSDQAYLQVRLLDYLGIAQAHALVGPSIGGFVALTFSLLFPERVKRIVSIGSGYKCSILNRLMLFEQVIAIENDPKFNGGFYLLNDPPSNGLALARIISHKSFVCLDALERRARNEVKDDCDLLSWYKLRAASESYMLHQGTKFALRFDANAYLRIADMWMNFHAAGEVDCENLDEALLRAQGYGHKWLVFGIDSDRCFLPEEQEDFADHLQRAGFNTKLALIHSEKGHDSFLIEPELYADELTRFLES